jgi:predicted RNase H-like HicB family nuclease
MTCALEFYPTSTGYSAHVPDLPGCAAAGGTLEGTRELIHSAMEMLAVA